MDDFERKKRELLSPLYFEMGAALVDSQGFEYGVALLLLHLSRIGVPGLEPSEHFAIMDNTSKRTAGQLVSMLKKRVTVSPEFEAALGDALDARNFLIHRSFMDNVERVADASSREALTKEFRKLRSRIQKAEKLIRPFVDFFSSALDGLDQAGLEAEVRSAMMGDPTPK